MHTENQRYESITLNPSHGEMQRDLFSIVKGVMESNGIRVMMSADCKHTDVASCWGWRRGKLLRRQSKDVLVFERGYLGDRFHWTSIAWNGLNGHAKFPDLPYDGGERFRKHFAPMKPWRTDGDYALLLGQVPGDASLKGFNMSPWYHRMASLIRKEHGIPVRFRPHPEAVRKGHNQTVHGTIRSVGTTLEEDLARAAFTVCYNSNSSVDSILAGVPCVVSDKGSMAYEVCGHDVAEIIRPDRDEWVHRLAWKQWSPEEIADGTALKNFLTVIR